MADMVKVVNEQSRLTQLLKDKLSSIDEETGVTNEELVANNLVEIAKGLGTKRDQLQAINLIYDRVEGKAKQEGLLDFLKSLPRKSDGVTAGKYRRTVAIEGEAEVISEDRNDEDSMQ